MTLSIEEDKFIETYLDKQIFVFDYDHTIKLHYLSLDQQEIYEKKLYNILFKLKTHYKKKIYLVSYNLKPHFNNDYKELFEEIFIPKPAKKEEFFILQQKMKCPYYIRCDLFYRYIPKYIHIKEIVNKNNADLNDAVFFDDNIEHIIEAQKYGIHSVLVNPLKGIDF